MRPTTHSVVPADIGRHVAALTERGPRHADDHHVVAATLRYLTDELSKLDVDVSVERYGGELPDVNLVGRLPGTEPDLPAIEVGAHWDSVPGSPGADDNASGLAGVIEIARLLTDLPRPRRGITFCLYGGEEDGFVGSSAHVARAGSVQGAIVLEMIGYRRHDEGSQRVPDGFAAFIDPPTRGDFIAMFGNETSADYVEALGATAAAYAPDLGVLALSLPTPLLPAVSRSDQVPYWNAGHKGVLVTDTAEYRNPHYHRASDTLDTLDLEFAASVTTIVAHAVHGLCRPSGRHHRHDG